MIIPITEDYTYNNIIYLKNDYVLNSHAGKHKITFKNQYEANSVLNDYKQLSDYINQQYNGITTKKNADINKLKLFDRGSGVYDILSSHFNSIVKVSTYNDVSKLFSALNRELITLYRSIEPTESTDNNTYCDLCGSYLDTLGICTNSDCPNYVHDGQHNINAK